MIKKINEAISPNNIRLIDIVSLFEPDAYIIQIYDDNFEFVCECYSDEIDDNLLSAEIMRIAVPSNNNALLAVYLYLD